LEGLAQGAQALLIEGEVGIGKTALWLAVLAAAVAMGYRVLRCGGDQAEARLSFAGLGDLFGGVADEGLGSLPGPQREALELALARRSIGAGRLPDAKTIGMGLRSLLVEIAQGAPVVVAIDDVQWLDGATARALAFVARRLEGHRVGIFATARAPTPAPDPLGLERALRPDRFSRVRLGPLSLGELQVLLEDRLGQPYPRPVLRRIAEVSDGNPLFALEITHALGTAPALEPGVPLPVPDDLRELVMARVAGLPPEGRHALLAAAALSHPTAEVIERCASAAGLLAAEEASLLRVQGERVVFVHPLYASAVYAAAASGPRRALHLQLVELVADPEEQARHLALGATPPDERVAAKLDVAALHARARGAWDAAGELLELARDFTGPARLDEKWARAVDAAEHHIHAGDRPRARALVDEALVDIPRGALRGKALRLMAEIRYNEESFAVVVELLEEALEQTDDPALQSTLELTLAFVCCNSLLGFPAADEHARRGVEYALRLGEGAALSEALAVQAVVGFLVGRGVDWDIVERSLALEDKARVLPVQMRPSLIAALLKLYVGRVAEARQDLRALWQVASDTGDESDFSYVLIWHAWLETQNCEFDTAVELAEQAAVQGRLTGGELNRIFGLSQRALANAHRGVLDETRSDAAEVSALCTQRGHAQPLLFAVAAVALLELSLGDPAAAWAATEPMVEMVEARGIAEPVPFGFVPLAVEALVALGELDRAEGVLDIFEGRAREVDRAWALATAGRCRALLLAARGDLDDADQVVQQALVEHARVDMPFELARTLFVQGQVRRRRREKRAARESLEQALALFEELGAPLWAEQARAELDRLGSRPAGKELTAAEQRVAELAAQGRSNKEIAGSLFVSVHTVEVHLSHAYAKLGVRSRAQLARRLSSSQHTDCCCLPGLGGHGTQNDRKIEGIRYSSRGAHRLASVATDAALHGGCGVGEVVWRSRFRLPRRPVVAAGFPSPARSDDRCWPCSWS
jgi:DNA-binding CsgD family transcriptional regulator